MVQAEGETVDQFAVRLRRKAQQCDYGEQMEAQIRDQIVSRCQSDELRRKLLEKGQTLTLKSLQDVARNYEAVKRQTKSMSRSNDSVNRVRDDRKKKYDDRMGNSRSGNFQSGGECWRCGRRGHFARDPQCPARGKTCSKCFQMGHFATVCKTRGDPRFRSGVRYMKEVKSKKMRMSMFLQELMKKADKEKLQSILEESQWEGLLILDPVQM